MRNRLADENGENRNQAAKSSLGGDHTGAMTGGSGGRPTMLFNRPDCAHLPHVQRAHSRLAAARKQLDAEAIRAGGIDALGQIVAVVGENLYHAPIHEYAQF